MSNCRQQAHLSVDQAQPSYVVLFLWALSLRNDEEEQKQVLYTIKEQRARDDVVARANCKLAPCCSIVFVPMYHKTAIPRTHTTRPARGAFMPQCEQPNVFLDYVRQETKPALEMRTYSEETWRSNTSCLFSQSKEQETDTTESSLARREEMHTAFQHAATRY